MESHHWIRQNVPAIHASAHRDDVGVFFHHQPTAVGEKETPSRVVWISVGFAEFMVDPVISHPFVQFILERILFIKHSVGHYFQLVLVLRQYYFLFAHFFGSYDVNIKDNLSVI